MFTMNFGHLYSGILLMLTMSLSEKSLEKEK